MTRRLVAIVANSLTSYRAAYLRRLAVELPEFDFVLLLTHATPELTTDASSLSIPQEIVRLDHHHPVRQASTLSLIGDQQRLWSLAATINRWLVERNASAIVNIGYNDVSRLRTMSFARRRSIATITFGASSIASDTATGVKRLAKRLWLARIDRLSDAVLCNGTLGRQFFERYGVDPAKIFVTPNETDYALFAPIGSKAVLTADPGGRKFLFVGRLVNAQKRVDLLIDAFADIATESPAASLTIVGTGQDEAALRSRVPASLSARVNFTGAINNAAELASVYRACDVLVVPSDTEPWGVVVNEAVGCGLAVIASTAVAAAHELSPDTLFPAGDRNALADGMRRLFDPAKLDEARTHARERLAHHRANSDPVSGMKAALEFAFRPKPRA